MPETSEYFLRLEAVNLNNFVYDTNDLSTIRGGGLLLLNAPRRVQKEFSKRLEPISLGASSGLFRFKVPAREGEDDLAKNLRQDVEDFLKQEGPLSHATFVVDVCKSSGNFAHDHETLLARNRWRQMQSPSLVFPQCKEVKSAARLRGVCEKDLVRPIGGSVEAPEGEGDQDGLLWVSSSVRARRIAGQNEKQGFYEKEVGDEVERTFTHDFSQLTGDEGHPLHHKMAVIYLDGNGFGKLKSKHCRTADLQEEFDHTLRGFRRSALESLLAKTDSEEGWQAKVDGERRRRLETLLWGGDELIWVVPAWKGWETLAGFYALSKGWNFRGERLTHAGGLVFCSHKAPIHRITTLAENLAGLAKERSRKDNFFAYQVLETYDDVGLSLTKYRQDRWPDFESWKRMILAGEAMNQVSKHASEIKSAVPRRRLQRLAQVSLERLGRKEKAECLDRRLERILSQVSKKATEGLSEAFGTGPARWLHLADLWDYLPGGGD